MSGTLLELYAIKWLCIATPPPRTGLDVQRLDPERPLPAMQFIREALRPGVSAEQVPGGSGLAMGGLGHSTPQNQTEAPTKSNEPITKDAVHVE